MKPEWTSPRMRAALARHFDWFHNRIMPEWEIDGGIGDMVLVSKSGYLTEIEIKVTVADWNTDARKLKWRKERLQVAKFYYAIPATLADSIPDWLPESAGILVVKSWGERDGVTEKRAPKRQRTQPITPETRDRMMEACYFRYWRTILKAGYR